MTRTQIPPRIAVVGAGIIGAAIGYHLAKSGAAPLIIDAAGGGGVATAASWAWLNASWGNRADYARLRRHSLALWRELAHALPELPVRMCGSLTYDLSETDLDQFAREYQAEDYPIRLVDRDEIARIEPNLARPPARAAHCPAEGVAEPIGTADALRRRAIELGATFLAESPVEQLVVTSDRISGFRSGGRITPIDVAVVCAGAATPHLLSAVGVSLPMEAPEGLLVHSEPLPPVLNGLVIAPEMHVRQTNQGRLIAGFDFVGTTVDQPGRAAERLIDAMNTQLRLPERARLAFTTVGLRPTPTDGYPVVGFTSGSTGLYVATMHSGMSLAAAIGKLAAAEILGGKPEPMLAPYRPQRFQPPEASGTQLA